MLRKLRSRKGFTLVELMIVVAIIGILAAIAIPNFLNFRLKAKASEAKSNLGAVRSTEVAYYAEWNTYIGGQTAVPILARDTHANGHEKISWDGARAGGGPIAGGVDGTASRFTILGFAPEGYVFFSYNLEGGATDSTAFTSNALGDLDDDSVISQYIITSNNTEITHTGGPF